MPEKSETNYDKLYRMDIQRPNELCPSNNYPFLYARSFNHVKI